MTEPFVLRGKKLLRGDEPPSADVDYDYCRQLWVHRASDDPLVNRLRRPVGTANFGRTQEFGETSITASKEGTDQGEVASLEASPFGETTLTRTIEGTDQLEIALGPTPFGETLVTATVEGIDQAEVATFDLDDPSHPDEWFGEATNETVAREQPSAPHPLI